MEQIGGVLVPQIMKWDVDGFQDRVGEQIVAVPVHQFWEPFSEVIQISPQERVQNCMPEQIMDSSVPLMEAVSKVTLQERVQNPFPEQSVGVPMPQLMEAVAEVIPQERVLNRTQEQVVGVPLPQLMEAVVEVTPQERVQNRTPEQIVGFPVPQIMEPPWTFCLPHHRSARFSPCRRQRNSWWNSRMSCLSLM